MRGRALRKLGGEIRMEDDRDIFRCRDELAEGGVIVQQLACETLPDPFVEDSIQHSGGKQLPGAFVDGPTHGDLYAVVVTVPPRVRALSVQRTILGVG
jgi:hypothetical protein